MIYTNMRKGKYSLHVHNEREMWSVQVWIGGMWST